MTGYGDEPPKRLLLHGPRSVFSFTGWRMRKTVVVAIGLLVACSPAARKPSRSECIEAFQISWAGITADHGQVLNALMDNMPAPPKRIEELIAIVVGRDRSTLYLQFKENCERKGELSNKLFQVWRDQNLELPEFVLILEPVVPSPSTIDVKGRYWRD